MIELNETFRNGGIYATISGMKTATCTIKPMIDGYEVKTSRKSNGSIRYNRFHGADAYAKAEAYALGYSNRIAKMEK